MLHVCDAWVISLTWQSKIQYKTFKNVNKIMNKNTMYIKYGIDNNGDGKKSIYMYKV